MSYHIPYYSMTLSDSIKSRLLEDSRPCFGIQDLKICGETGGLENKEAMLFLVELWKTVAPELSQVLKQRLEDRKFIDQRTKSARVYNQKLKVDFASSEYRTVIGEYDSRGRLVIGPLHDDYAKNVDNKKIAPIPEYLKGPHVTLFGPPDSEKMCINAMNSFHRKLKNEPQVVAELVDPIKYTPKWGADNEDSKTPLHKDFQSAGVNLTKCLEYDLDFVDEKGKHYKLEKEHLSHAIKRFPGLALPSLFLFYKDEPVPLHIYDFALHVHRNWNNPEALVFYVPKLENEEEARYIKNLMQTAEELTKKVHPEYKMGTIKLMIVLENPRAVFRVNEIMDELYPYFVGASLGWHDYLGSTARLFKEDPNYRIPVKADPDIVIKYIKASHRLLADVVGPRGGIKVGGMYGILPTTYDIDTPSFQVTMLGYIRDVVTQLKRDLTGFWVAHPDFVRIGMALVEAFKIHQKGDSSKLDLLVKGLLHEKYHAEILKFIHGPDIEGLDIDDPLYARSLLVADVGTSNIIANNDPEEIRYNVFQSLQYLTDWLTGNGCVALPTNIKGEAVRIMDDLATAERSRWEVWHEIYHGRFSLYDFIKIAHEEMHFIRKDLSDQKKIVQVKWSAQNAKWYSVAMKLMIKLMTDKKPCEFAPELLLPFTIDEIRNSEDPWEAVLKWDASKYQIDKKVEVFHDFFERCGDQLFAEKMSHSFFYDEKSCHHEIMAFSKKQILSAASFHGDIGESKKKLDQMASQEQAKVSSEDRGVIQQLQTLGEDYKKKFGMKFLVSAKGKNGIELLEILKKRINNSQAEEEKLAKEALFEITHKRMLDTKYFARKNHVEKVLQKFGIHSAQVSVSGSHSRKQLLSFGSDESQLFEIASLSKTIGSLIAVEFFKERGIVLETSVNRLLSQYGSTFKLKNKDSVEVDEVTLEHLMNHSALNMHYVNGVPLGDEFPTIDKFLLGNECYGYEPIYVLGRPGVEFHYSGAGFIVLEYLLELISGKKFPKLMSEFADKFQLPKVYSESDIVNEDQCISGYQDNGVALAAKRLKFPTIAAGMLASADSIHSYLQLIEQAYHDFSHPLHDSSARLLLAKDLGSQDFMRANMGLGVFVVECGENRFMLHQGANDGFRAIFLHCYQGPDRGVGFCIFANAELNAVKAIASIAQLILKEFKVSGIDYDKFKDTFSTIGLRQEEIVNLGYRDLFLNAFEYDLPEVYEHEKLDPLSTYNHLVGSEIIKVSNQKFARAENVISPYLPIFDPAFYGRQGKVMDSWESTRHNPREYDFVHLKFDTPVDIEFVSLCTKYHLGNQFNFVSLEGIDSHGKQIEVLEKTSIEGHSFKKLKLPKRYQDISELIIKAYPDGGLSRVGVYEEIPESHKSQFVDIKQAQSIKYDEPIPVPLKPLGFKYEPTQEMIKKNWSKIKSGELVDVACSAFGGKVLSQSNQHYGPAVNTISPFAPIDMFDGFETARSRKAGNFEEMVVGFEATHPVEVIDLDYSYFVNNNPLYVELEARVDGQWKTLAKKTIAKAFAGNVQRFNLPEKIKCDQIRLKCFPDGGVNRIHVYSRK